MGYQDDLLLAFVGSYGRLCHLVARALTQGHAEAAVVEAAMGAGSIPAPVYAELRRQRERVDRAVERAIDACVSHVDIVKRATDVNVAAQQEWMIDLPKFAEKR